jgi:hypothetical protein
MYQDDAAFLMADLLAIGFSVKGDYALGATTATGINLVFEIASADPLEAMTGQNQNESATVTVLRSELPAWDYGGKITVVSGAWAGVWTISGHVGSDDSTVILNVTKQKVTKIRSAGAEKLIGEE